MSRDQPLPFSVDRMLANEMPKIFRLADDMHDMASYMNDLRIVAIFGTVLGVVGGIGFLLFKYSQRNKSAGYDVCPQDDSGRISAKYGNPNHPGAFTPVPQWQDRSKVSDIESKLAIKLPENADGRNGDQKYTQGKGDIANV